MNKCRFPGIHAGVIIRGFTGKVYTCHRLPGSIMSSMDARGGRFLCLSFQHLRCCGYYFTSVAYAGGFYSKWLGLPQYFLPALWHPPSLWKKCSVKYLNCTWNFQGKQSTTGVENSNDVDRDKRFLWAQYIVWRKHQVGHKYCQCNL